MYVPLSTPPQLQYLFPPPPWLSVKACKPLVGISSNFYNFGADDELIRF